MLIDNETLSKQSEVEELFPFQPPSIIPPKAADILQSSVITGYEAAVDQGMRPGDALSLILSWVSSEIHRAQFCGSPSARPG